MKRIERVRLLAVFSLMLVAGLCLANGPVLAQAPEVKITEAFGQRCIESNGVPNHEIGRFPNPGNPNSFSSQRLSFCFDLTPEKNTEPTRGTPNVGIALNGIVIRPGTADWYDASSPRGFSRDRSSGWNLEGIGSADALGMDRNNAHVDHRGLYHYHGVPVGLLKLSTSSHIGYAADGFEIHYVGADAKPSYILKPGTRPTAPGGAYNGRFIEDWKFMKGAGNLDECNGGTINGKYVYFATDRFPFYPRCHWGDVSNDFQRRGPRDRGDSTPPSRPRHPAGGGGPLAAAATDLGISERALAEAVGPPPPNTRRASKILGIPEDRIREALRRNRR